MTKLHSLLQTVRYKVVNRLTQEGMTHVCRGDGVLIQVCQYMARKWSDMGMFRVLRRTHCNPIFALLAIARFVEVDWDATGVDWFLFEYERSKFTFAPPVHGMTRKRANGTEVPKGYHDEVRPVYLEKFVNCGMYCDFAERTW